MEFKPDITKEFIYNNVQGGNIHYHIKPFTLYEFFNNTSRSKQIPNYQRPYSWGKSNVEYFLFDILDTMLSIKTRDSWFLGCIYVTKESDIQDMAEILDGQQRITTLQIIFNELVLSKFYDNSQIFSSQFNTSVECLKDCLYYKSAGNRIVRFSTDPITNDLLHKYLSGSEKVNCETSYKNFIQDFETKLSSSIHESKSHKTLYDNIKIVRSFINEKLINLKGNFDQKLKLEEYNKTSDRLQYYIETLLYRLWLINIPLIQENISVEIFESLNNRGKPLSMIDKFQFKSLTKDFGYEDEIRKNWSNIFKLIDNLQSSAIDIKFIKSDEDLIKIYFESKLGDEISNDEYLDKFDSECLKNYDSLNKFFHDLIKITEFFIDISNPDTSKFISSFKSTKNDKKVRAITQVLLSFLNIYKNPIRLVFCLLTKYDYSKENNIVIGGIWEILKLAYYKNLVVGEQGNKIRSDFNLYIRKIINEDEKYFIGLFLKLYNFKDLNQNHKLYNLLESHPASFQFDNVNFPTPTQGEINYVSSLDSKSNILNTTDNQASSLILILYVLLNNYESFSVFSSSAFQAQNLEHIFPRAYKNHWKDKIYRKEDCEFFLENTPNTNYYKIVKNSLQSDFELRDYKTVPSHQSQSLVEWIGNKLLINDLANKKIGNKNYDVKYGKYETEQYILPNINSKDLKLDGGTNFNHEQIIKRTIIIVEKISDSLLCEWDSI